MTVNPTERAPREVLADLRAQYPDSPFLALGQTVFWDEPMKAALRRLLDESGLGGQMVIGVHDTDYFAKVRLRRSGVSRFALMPHNDGTTRDLWSAAGEISTLFGSETFPARHDYVKWGVAYEKACQASGLDKQAFLDAITEAWGWRGLVYTGSRDLIVNRLALREVGDGILQMLAWGFDNAVSQVVSGCCQDEARRVGDMILDWCRAYRQAYPDQNLSNLYQHILPKFYELLLGETPANVTVSCTTDLLRLAPDTASLPRFRFVDLFLNPETRERALNAYNQTLAGTEMYTLDRFGAGALPFDLIVPESGRGTLRLNPRVLFVETPQPIAIALKKPIESIQELAEVLAAKLGPNVTLVGKAVSLVSMLAQEFLFVFNEEGSLYVRRTRQMNETLARQGIALDMRPIVRLRYNTWDALSVGASTLKPAPHLAAAFGQPTITTPEFAANWREVLAAQRALCTQLKQLQKPLELLTFLAERDAETDWSARREEYRQAKGHLCALREQAAAIQALVNQDYARLKQLNTREQAAQREMGAHFRATTTWTPNDIARRAAYKGECRALAQHKRLLCSEIAALKSRRWQIERGPEATRLRADLGRIEGDAELARLKLVRNALLVLEGLPHTNHRPSAWWLPMLDASGAWFQRIVATTQVYTEPLLTQEVGSRR